MCLKKIEDDDFASFKKLCFPSTLDSTAQRKLSARPTSPHTIFIYRNTRIYLLVKYIILFHRLSNYKHYEWNIYDVMRTLRIYMYTTRPEQLHTVRWWLVVVVWVGTQWVYYSHIRNNLPAILERNIFKRVFINFQ